MSTKPDGYFADTVKRHNMDADCRSFGEHAKLPDGHPLERDGWRSASRPKNPVEDIGANREGPGVGGRQASMPKSNSSLRADKNKTFHS